ncbi:hypothetical protein [Ascidiaceihabitans sp.]|uniref:hypothetical protein n=1 Tax=Ascidiaceihabitans sp. TaxID=1872644 RepID=UPI0032975A79
MKKLFAIVALSALAACDTMTAPADIGTKAAEAQAATTTPINQIQLVSGNTVNNGNFTVIGEVKADVGKKTAFGKTPTVEDAQTNLRIKAAGVGADAVINTQISDVTICALSWGCRVVSGTAVKFN